MTSCTHWAENGAKLEGDALAAVLSVTAFFGRSDKQRRTQELLRTMRAQGFEPARGDWCILNDGLREEFTGHYCFCYSPYVNGVAILSHRLLGIGEGERFEPPVAIQRSGRT